MADLVPLAIASAFWPALIAVVVISLRAAHPARLMASFLLAGLLTTVSIGAVLVRGLQSTSLTSSSESRFGPGLQITVGVLALLAALVLQRRSQREPPAPEAVPAEPGRLERMLDRGAPLAFVAGVLLNVIPGVVPLVALGRIAELDEGLAGTIALLLGFYLIMFAFVEVPLVAYLVAPDATAARTRRFNAWLDRNAARIAVIALAAAGAYLIVRGLVDALS